MLFGMLKCQMNEKEENFEMVLCKMNQEDPEFCNE